jgi:hypothetical protein
VLKKTVLAISYSISHLFFGCVVAKVIWKEVSRFCGYEVGTDYLSVAGKWLDKNKYCVINMITAAVLWGLWLIRNDLFSINRSGPMSS